MSELSEIYDAIILEMTGLFSSTHNRIPNPYSLEDNPDLMLNKGWGVAVGASNPRELDYCHVRMERTFRLITTRKMYYIDTKQDIFDATLKELLDDHTIIQKEFYKTDEIGVEAKVDQITIGSSSEPRVIFSEKYKYLSMFTEVFITHSDVVTA